MSLSPTYERQVFASVLEDLNSQEDVSVMQVIDLAERSGVDLRLLLEEHLRDENLQ